MDQREKKTPCENKGHFWQSTTSQVYRYCARNGCKATRHYINGAWVETQPTKQKTIASPVEQQMDLWA